MPTTTREKIKLARAFSEEIQNAFSWREFNEMIDRNKAEPDDGNVCHTHDYCDANMLMQAAFIATFDREPDMDNQADVDTWNDAWDIAKAAEFFA